MKILMVCHMPWRRDLGGPRIQLELAEELRRMGHEVEKFSWEDAYPRARPSMTWIRQLFGFSRRVEAMLRANPGKFDVVDAHQGNVLSSKQDLGIKGVVAIRSAGLVHFHAAVDRARGPVSRTWRAKAGSLRRRFSYFIAVRAAERSFDSADRILLPNEDELIRVQERAEWAEKARLVPNAIARSTWEALSTLEPRLPTSNNATVAFIGSWSTGKGSKDWPNIVRYVWSACPETRFLFLGTSFDEAAIRAGLGVSGDQRVEVMSKFRPDDLPNLLMPAHIGAFPSHLEGFGLAVLEMLAASMPVVAFDSIGPRQLLVPVDHRLLVPVGDSAGMAARLVELLVMDGAEFRDLATRCRRQASQFTWASLAQRTLDAYGVNALPER